VSDYALSGYVGGVAAQHGQQHSNAARNDSDEPQFAEEPPAWARRCTRCRVVTRKPVDPAPGRRWEPSVRRCSHPHDPIQMVQLSPCVDVFGHSGAGADSSGTKRSLMPPDPGCVQVCMHLCRGV